MARRLIPVKRIKERLISEIHSGFSKRGKKYKSTGVLENNRTRSFVYLVEREGLGKQLADFLKNNNAAYKLAQLLAVKRITKDVLDCLRIAGGVRFSETVELTSPKELAEALRIGTGVTIGEIIKRDRKAVTEAIRLAGGREFGKALERTGSKSMIKAFSKYGGTNIGWNLKNKFDETVRSIKFLQ